MLYTSTNILVGGSTVFSRSIERIRGVLSLWSVTKVRTSEAVTRREPQRLTLVEQWAAISRIIGHAASGAEEAMRCHKSAAMQVDLAQYALGSLVDELAAVMNVGERRSRANVHVLDIPLPPTPPRPFDDAIAA
jgi:hypothetical protein